MMLYSIYKIDLVELLLQKEFKKIERLNLKYKKPFKVNKN
jgi:hypothetical protein